MKVGKNELKLSEKFLAFGGKRSIICFYHNLVCSWWLLINKKINKIDQCYMYQAKINYSLNIWVVFLFIT